MELWCIEQFGPSPEPWFQSLNHVWFKDEKDAMLFKLRWVEG